MNYTSAGDAHFRCLTFQKKNLCLFYLISFLFRLFVNKDTAATTLPYVPILDQSVRDLWTTNWHRNKVLLEHIVLTLSASLHQCSILIFKSCTTLVTQSQQLTTSRPSIFWGVTRPSFVDICRRSGIVCVSHLQGSSSPIIMHSAWVFLDCLTLGCS
jgi:hypothetical protein